MNERGHPVTALDAPLQPTREKAPPVADTARLRRLVDDHYDFVWRTLRFLGVAEAAAEDGAQQVFCVVARKLADIAPGAEVSFLFATASRVASDARRAVRRRPVASEGDVDLLELPLPSIEELVDQRRARETLDQVLAAMPEDLRTMLVLFEIEELHHPPDSPRRWACGSAPPRRACAARARRSTPS